MELPVQISLIAVEDIFNIDIEDLVFIPLPFNQTIHYSLKLKTVNGKKQKRELLYLHSPNDDTPLSVVSIPNEEAFMITLPYIVQSAGAFNEYPFAYYQESIKKVNAALSVYALKKLIIKINNLYKKDISNIQHYIEQLHILVKQAAANIFAIIANTNLKWYYIIDDTYFCKFKHVSNRIITL
jgi:intein/homing endonuclease